MAKKKNTSGKTKPVGPNRFPEAVTAKQKEAAAATCRYLGRDYGEGDTITYQGRLWRCSGGAWV
jgi:hypothetical protein